MSKTDKNFEIKELNSSYIDIESIYDKENNQISNSDYFCDDYTEALLDWEDGYGY